MAVQEMRHWRNSVRQQAIAASAVCRENSSRL